MPQCCKAFKEAEGLTPGGWVRTLPARDQKKIYSRTIASSRVLGMVRGKQQSSRAAFQQAETDELFRWLRDVAMQRSRYEIRAEIMARHVPLLAAAAEKLRQRLPPSVGVDDLQQAGAFGLAQAIDGFDLQRGIKFTSFAQLRVQGAMLDWLRNVDWAPRQERSRAKVDGRHITKMQSIDTPLPGHDKPAGKTIADKNAGLEIKGIEDREEFDQMIRALRGNHHVVITKKFVDGQDQKEIADDIGLSPSRVWQLLREAMEILKATVKAPAS